VAGEDIKRRMKFTIYHGVAVSIALHTALALPFVYGLKASSREPSTLVLDIQGITGDMQVEERIQQETKADGAQIPAETREAKLDMAEPAKAPAEQEMPKQDQTQMPKPADFSTVPTSGRQVDAVADEGVLPPPTENPQQNSTPPPPAAQADSAEPAPSAPAGGTPGIGKARNISGDEEKQNGQTIDLSNQREESRRKHYVKELMKKIGAHLVYPDEGRRAGLHGSAAVSFTILPNGQIRPETLKIVTSSGEPKLDASALKTVRSSLPFDPPPEAMSVTIVVDFGHRG
jgi:protein TonB